MQLYIYIYIYIYRLQYAICFLTQQYYGWSLSKVSIFESCYNAWQKGKIAKVISCQNSVVSQLILETTYTCKGMATGKLTHVLLTCPNFFLSNQAISSLYSLSKDLLLCKSTQKSMWQSLDAVNLTFSCNCVLKQF